MRVSRHPDVRKDLKSLRKYRGIPLSMEFVERLLAANQPPAGIPWGSFALERDDGFAVIIKTRLVVPGTNFGKSKGLRYVYERLFHEGEEWCCCFAVYMHSQGIDDSEVRKTIEKRFADFQIEWDLEENECTPDIN